MSGRCTAGIVWVAAILSACAAHADVAVCDLFGDHMVLQRDMPLPVWGTARPGEQVTVTLGARRVAAVADPAGCWRARLEPVSAGGPHEMVVSGDNTITLRDVMVGEVWVCSGQSNMAMTVARAMNAEKEIAAADHPGIRLLKVTRRPSDEPAEFAGKQWQVCSPQAVEEFSAVAYFFGRELHAKLNVPVGLIDSAVGGTPAESWIPKPVLESDAAFKPIFDRWEERIAEARRAAKQASKANAASRSTDDRPAAGRGGRQTARPAPSLSGLLKSSQRPAVLYNGMIHPLVPYAIRGATWYQGEANAPRAYQYRKLLPALVGSWREAWGQGDFPFLIVQLAGYSRGEEPFGESDWAELREAQVMALSLPRTGLAVTTDISEATNIHPVNKQEVGRRLALAARHIAYGEKLAYSGPMYAGMKIEADTIRIEFEHVESGLAVSGGGALKGFAIAGADRRFVPAEAVIDGRTVVVRSREVARPAAVRFGWADVPETNLVNKAGLPASPFRTDDWPGITENAR